MVLRMFNNSITFVADGQIRPHNIMGKDNLIIGTARGKLGDVVFYRTGGEQRFRTRVKPMNPRTNAQLIQRCVVSTVVKAYSNFVTVCDHAFQNYIGKLKNHQRYMRLNIMDFRPIAIAQVARWSPILWSYAMRNYNWAKKDDVNTYVNPYILSEGDLPSIVPVWSGSYFDGAKTDAAQIVLNADETGKFPNIETMTYQDFCTNLGINAGDQLTFVMQLADNTTGAVTMTSIARIVVMPSDGDMNSIMFTKGTGSIVRINKPNKENYGNVYFNYASGGSEPLQLFFSPTADTSLMENYASVAVIVSRFEDNMWRRSNSKMVVEPAFANLSNLPDAVASYLKSDTSSLYLNQATTGERQALEARTIELMSDETDMYGMTIAEDEEKSPKRKK